MAFVGADLRRVRRVLAVLARGQAAARAVPGRRDLDVVLADEAGPGLMPVGTPVRHLQPRCGLTPLVLPHRPGADSCTPDRLSACHARSFAQTLKRCTRPSSTITMPQITAEPTVMRFRLRSATPEDPRLEDMPPPNMSDRSEERRVGRAGRTRRAGRD